MDYKLTAFGVRQNILNVDIPNDTRNRHWLEYLAWVAAGNIADPADALPIPDTPGKQAQDEAMNNPAMRGLIKALAARLGITPAQLIAEMKAQA